MSREVLPGAYKGTLGKYSWEVELKLMLLGKIVRIDGQQSDTVPDVILGVLWKGT